VRALRRFFRRLIFLATRQRDEERLRAEIEEHLALQATENVRAGLSPIEAHRSLVSYDLYKYLRDNTKGFSELAAFSSGQLLFGVRRSGNSEAAQSYPGLIVCANVANLMLVRGSNFVSSSPGRIMATRARRT